MKRSDDNRYTVDYEAFETAITKHDVKLFIHCNPHNPVGHVWTETEMDRLFNTCKQHNVLIISDENPSGSHHRFNTIYIGSNSS